MRMSSGPSVRNEKPRSGASSCSEETPRSSATPLTAAMPSGRSSRSISPKRPVDDGEAAGIALARAPRRGAPPRDRGRAPRRGSAPHRGARCYSRRSRTCRRGRAHRRAARARRPPRRAGPGHGAAVIARRHRCAAAGSRRGPGCAAPAGGARTAPAPKSERCCRGRRRRRRPSSTMPACSHSSGGSMMRPSPSKGSCCTSAKIADIASRSSENSGRALDPGSQFFHPVDAARLERAVVDGGIDDDAGKALAGQGRAERGGNGYPPLAVDLVDERRKEQRHPTAPDNPPIGAGGALRLHARPARRHRPNSWDRMGYHGTSWLSNESDNKTGG